MFDPENDHFGINEHSKEKYFYLLKDGTVTDHGEHGKDYEYKQSELVKLTENLMDWLRIPYSAHRDEGDRKLADFTQQERDFLYPFALVLACLDGNAFRNPEEPQNDLVYQYVPDAYKVLMSNTLRMHELAFFLHRSTLSIPT